MNFGQSISRNIKFGIGSRLVSSLINFFLFPFVLFHVGKETYGMYLLVMTVTGYMGLLEFGVMSALTKYVAEYSSRNEGERACEVVNATLTFFFCVGVLIFLGLTGFSVVFSQFFPISPENHEIVRQLFLVGGVSALFIWPLNTFSGAVQGLNLWTVIAWVNIGTSIAYGVGAYALLTNGYGIVALFGFNQIVTCLGAVVYSLFTRKLLKFSLQFPYMHWQIYSKIFSFSMFMFLSSVLNIFLFQIHNLLIGYFLTPASISLYAVANNLQSYLRMINGTLGGPPWTVAAQLEGKRDFEGQRKLVCKGTRLMGAVFIPIVLILIVFADSFIPAWVGGGFEESIVATRVILLFWLFNGTLEIAGGMLSAKGMVRESLKIQVLMAAANILICVCCIKSLGILAVALGLTVSMIVVGFPLSLHLSLTSLNIAWADFLRRSVAPNLSHYILAGISAWAFSRLAVGLSLKEVVALMGASYVGSLALLYLLVLCPEEQAEVKSLLLPAKA